MKANAPSPTELELASRRAFGLPYWRSLAEAAHGTPPGEFAAPWPDGVSRRHFLKFMGASLALSGLSACTREPIHPIVPYVKQPEQLVPGRPLHYATGMCHNGFATGLLVQSNEGHPTKIEGNPSHPASLGATGIFQQAALLDLYDPDRARITTQAGAVANFPLFLSALNEALAGPRARHGAGLRVLTQSITSPTLLAQVEELLRQFPEARWHQYQPISRDNILEGARLAFDSVVETRCRFDRARVILSLDADFLFHHPFHLAYTRQFADARRLASENLAMNRLYLVETTPSLTGSMADHRLPASSAQVEDIAFALGHELGVSGVSPIHPLPEVHRRWVAALAQDLRENAGAGLVLAGEEQPPQVHALAHLLNDHLGQVGQTLDYTASAEPHWVNQRQSLAQLAQEMEAGVVDCLMILGGNPVFDAPADFQFGDHLARVKFRAHLSSHTNETSARCHWHIPESHFLESWSDARSFDGTTTIIQPLIYPLYDSRTPHELLNVVMHTVNRPDYDLVRDHWAARSLSPDFEESWRLSLHEGRIEGTSLPPLKVKPRSDLRIVPSPREGRENLEICFRPDPTIWDGRFANNAWLQELPKPFSKVTWDNPALVSPTLAQRLQLTNGDLVEMRCEQRVLTVPIWIMPGQAENAVTLHLGLGRTHVGDTGKDVGCNSYLLRASENFWFGSRLELVKTGRQHLLATTQHSHNIEGRDIVRDGTLAGFRANPAVTQKNREPAPARDDTLYNVGEFDNQEPAWGMAINLNACIGCNACAIACQAENNIPVVGKEQVAVGREMAWIRIDQYFQGSLENPRIQHQPVPCMHCENAPCELVCPVGATLHDHEGLNLQVYNRCVGTRYCSNNCPYKVRRFNFYRYADYETPSLKPMRNPNVTVRWRGIMEKCSYCIQRISTARIASQIENRPIRDGEIKTACQQVCPAQAIAFGNIHDPKSAVARLKSSPLNYAMLGELNTRPRTTYLTRLRNPNPALEDAL